jgi:hypothetical protein
MELRYCCGGIKIMVVKRMGKHKATLDDTSMQFSIQQYFIYFLTDMFIERNFFQFVANMFAQTQVIAKVQFILAWVLIVRRSKRSFRHEDTRTGSLQR